jgi:hypothetical protein
MGDSPDIDAQGRILPAVAVPMVALPEEERLDPMAKWRDLVGGFILAFGDIELTSVLLWREHVRRTPVPQRFKERTGIVLAALRRLSDPPIAIINAFESAMRLADKRNTVAHHPLQVQVFEHSKTGEVVFEQAISSATRDDYIDDLELTELRAEAEDIAARLYMALGFTDPRERGPVPVR